MSASLPAPTAAPQAVAAQPAPALGASLRARLLPTARYLMRTDVHTFAFSVAANAILSFFPFMVLMMTMVRHVFRSQAMYVALVELLRQYLPTGQDFVIRNLNALVNARRGAQAVSLGMLLITSGGVFTRLEVALNRVWGFHQNRSYVANQIISLGLAFGCGVLALASVALTAGNRVFMLSAFRSDGLLAHALAFAGMKLLAMGASILIFFLIYWLLPNGPVPRRAVLPVAVAIGLLWEAGKYAYILALPHLNFQRVYGPFSLSVTLMFWAFLSGMLLLAGAHLSARPQPAAGTQQSAQDGLSP